MTGNAERPPSRLKWVAFGVFVFLTLVTSFVSYKVFDTWGDRYGAAGYFVGLLGFAYVLFELLRSKGIAEAGARVTNARLIL